MNPRLAYLSLILCLLAACSPKKPFSTEELEKMHQPLTGYYFLGNPNHSGVEASRDALAVVIEGVNRERSNQARQRGQDTVTGLAMVDSTGQPVKVRPDRGFLVVTNDSVMQELIRQYTSGRYKGEVDFTKEFVLILYHPPVNLAGAVFYDNITLNTQDDDDRTLLIEPDGVGVAALSPSNTFSTSFDWQTKLFRIQRHNFRRVGILPRQDQEAATVYVSLQ